MNSYLDGFATLTVYLTQPCLSGVANSQLSRITMLHTEEADEYPTPPNDCQVIPLAYTDFVALAMYLGLVSLCTFV